MQPGTILNGKYQVLQEIGKGGFGIVFLGKQIRNNKPVAIKVDWKRKNQASIEAKILEQIDTGVGIPKLFDKGWYEGYSWFAMQLLGVNLHMVFKHCNERMNLSTSCTIMQQCLERLKFLHSCGYVHRDIKPQQFVFGIDGNLIYLIDFGLAKKYMIQKNHMQYQSHCPRAGNCTFSSVNNHMGIRQSRRDDLESLSYMLVYMFKGFLPWQISKYKDSFIKWQKTFIIKTSISVKDLCRGCPPEFQAFVNYTRMLRFEENPNYEYLNNLLEVVIKQVDQKFDVFNFVSLMNSNLMQSQIDEFNINAAQRRSKTVQRKDVVQKSKKRSCSVISDLKTVNQKKPINLKVESDQNSDQANSYIQQQFEQQQQDSPNNNHLIAQRRGGISVRRSSSLNAGMIKQAVAIYRGEQNDFEQSSSLINSFEESKEQQEIIQEQDGDSTPRCKPPSFNNPNILELRRRSIEIAAARNYKCIIA